MLGGPNKSQRRWLPWMICVALFVICAAELYMFERRQQVIDEINRSAATQSIKAREYHEDTKPLKLPDGVICIGWLTAGGLRERISSPTIQLHNPPSAGSPEDTDYYLDISKSDRNARAVLSQDIVQKIASQIVECYEKAGAKPYVEYAERAGGVAGPTGDVRRLGDYALVSFEHSSTLELIS